jgi:hypothetical protein
MALTSANDTATSQRLTSTQCGQYQGLSPAKWVV